MVIASAMTPSISTVLFRRQKPRWVLAAAYSGGNPAPKKLILYSKPGCCLCDGLKEKLTLAFTLGGPDSLQDVELQTRDITTNPEWEKCYQYEIPVLARLNPDGTEKILPRLSPRIGVEMIQKKIASILRQ